MKYSVKGDHMAIWIAFASLLLAIIALTVSVCQHKSQKELSLSVEKNRVYQAVWSAKLLVDQVTGLKDVISGLEDQLGIDATTDQTLTEMEESLVANGLPAFLAKPGAFWTFTDKLLQKTEDQLNDPKQKQSPAFYHELFGDVEALVKVMQVYSGQLTAKRERLRRKAKENAGEPTSGG